MSARLSDTVVDGTHESHGQARRGRAGRRVMVAVVAVFLAVGLAGWWGPRQGAARASGEQVEIELSYPRVTRGGLPGAWRLVVARTDGGSLEGQVVVSNRSAYISTFDHNAVDPVPAESWVSDDLLYWSFDVPAGVRRFTVSFDARVQPDARWRKPGRTAVEFAGERLTLDYTTWVLP